MTNIDLDETYCFTLTDVTDPNYHRCGLIIRWLHDNLVELRDDNNKPLFSKVNYGYNESTLKGFGNRPVCDVYLTDTNYSTGVNGNLPSSVTSNIIVYLKGNMNNVYLKACELNDYLIQQFSTNNSFRILKDADTGVIVHETQVKESNIRIIPTGKTYGVLVGLELEHSILGA